MAAIATMPTTDTVKTRWVQLGLGLVAMMAISSPQYVWTLFLKPFQTTTGAGLAAIQFTFSLLIVLQTFFSPAQGWLIERFGPRALITTGAALSGLGWISSAWVGSLWGLYATYGLFCGVGTGIVYVGIVGLMVRWFPRARGFATGVVAAGYGFGAILTTFPIDASPSALFSAWSAWRPPSSCAYRNPRRPPSPARRPALLGSEIMLQPKCCARRCSGCSSR
jgi:OFA family oxalate/formate antiporter-like MFS transporter